MKKKWKLILLVVIILIVLLFPIPAVYKDGGTRTFTSLTYKVIVWKRIDEPSGYRTGTEFHIFPNNFHDLDYYNK